MQKRSNMRLDALLAFFHEAMEGVQKEDYSKVVAALCSYGTIIFDCDRCTFFVVKPFSPSSDVSNTDLIGWWKPEDGVMQKFRAKRAGFVGMTVTTGEAMNIPDCWKDPRFSRDVDISTGYRTHNMLCAPVKAVSGEVIGVVQLINKKEGKPFNQDDDDSFKLMAKVLSDVSGLVVHEDVDGAAESVVHCR